jgi:hypothetical protein
MWMVGRGFGNWSGIASVGIMCVFWLCMRYAPPLSNVYLRYVGVPAAILLALVLAAIAVARASKWWALALILPAMAILGLLSLFG